MEAEVRVCFDKKDVFETELLKTEDEKELRVDRSSSNLKEEAEQEKVVDDYILEFASSEKGKSVDLNHRDFFKICHVIRQRQTFFQNENE